MNVAAVLDEIMAAASAVVPVPRRWGERPPSPPMALVDWPTKVLYDAGGRGFDRYPDVALIVLIGRPADPAAHRSMLPYLDGTGPQSIKQAIEAYRFTTCVAVRVAEASPEVVTLSGTDLLAATFHLDIAGRR
jgi:hypothetical protein